MLLIRNNTLSLRGIPMIQNKLITGTLNLYPGVNEVKEDQWDLARVHVADALEDEALEVLSATGEYPLLKLNPKQAVKTVKQTNVEETLTRWLKSEKRDLVVAAIKEQLGKLELTPEEKESSKKAMKVE